MISSADKAMKLCPKLVATHIGTPNVQRQFSASDECTAGSTEIPGAHHALASELSSFQLAWLANACHEGHLVGRFDSTVPSPGAIIVIYCYFHTGEER